MTAHRFARVLLAGTLGLLAPACAQPEGASGPIRASSDVTTTSAVVAGPAAPCARGEVRAWNNGEILCVRSCAGTGGCPDGRAARRCAANQILAGAPDSKVDYCVERP